MLKKGPFCKNIFESSRVSKQSTMTGETLNPPWPVKNSERVRHCTQFCIIMFIIVAADIQKDNLCYKMFLEEVKREKREVIEKIDSVKQSLEEGNAAVLNKVQDLARMIEDKEVKQSDIPRHAAKEGKADWEEWLKISKELKHFDTDSNQYILVVDKINAADAPYVTSLGSIPWKLVLDLDPDSDIDGLLNKISPDVASGVVVSHTPSQLANGQRVIDSRRIQWVFVNGKNKDTDQDAPKSKFSDWNKSFSAAIFRLIDECCLKFDNMKPTFCIILNMQNSSMKIADRLIENIDSIFDSYNFESKYVFFESEFDVENYPNSLRSPLSIKFLSYGIHSQIGHANTQYNLPSQQQGQSAPLSSQKYNFISEYLEVLYKGCENIPTEVSADKLQHFEDKHLISFLKGNAISFESLSLRHDATRTLTTAVCNHIHKLSARLHVARIVQIAHSPGTGGTTIARRVLWNLHEDYPCAVVKMTTETDTEGEQFFASLSKRIAVLEDVCDLSPVILIDGNSRQVKTVSDHLVRKLSADSNIKAIILRCVYPLGNERNNDSYFVSSSNFQVKSVLEENQPDLNQFKKAYALYCDKFNESEHQEPRRRIDLAKRVFHFPMMAMLGEFEQLDNIVKRSLDRLKEDHSTEYEVAILVAFLQIYANRETPASLVAKCIGKEHSTYEETNKNFSDELLNLMVSKKACSKTEWIGLKNSRSNYDEDDSDNYNSDEEGNLGIKWYTFQHHIIADRIIAHSQRSLDDITSDFVKSFLADYNKQAILKSLISDLFLYNIEKKADEHFSRLIMKLESAGRIFEEAAKKTKDAVFYSHVARYYAAEHNPPDFKKAKALIKEGLEVDKGASIDQIRRVRDSEGHILLREMKQKKREIRNVDDLEQQAAKALDCLRKARDNPPMTFPNPLMGEINVWQFCFDWIINWKASNVKEAVSHIMDSDFFSCAIGDCFFLLDKIDQIVQSVSRLPDPTYTMRLANDKRLALVQALGTTKGGTKRAFAIQSLDIARLCEEIGSKGNSKHVNEKEIIRLRVSWMINQAGKDIHLMAEKERPILQGLLERLVNDYNAYDYAYHLLSVSTIQKESYELEQAFKIATHWQKRRPHDAFSYFFQYIISFLQVLHGSVFEYRPLYENAVDNCKKKCEGNHRKYRKRYYISKDKDDGRISQLISPEELETRYKGKQGKAADEIYGPNFWDLYGRNYLRECRGRMRVTKNSPRGKEYPHIALEQGGLKISVDRNSIGEADQDFRRDSRVSFVVLFTLNGPTAKAIRFENAEKGASSPSFSRQPSKNEETRTRLNKNKGK